MSMTAKPFKAVERSGYWIAIDTRTDKVASYPTTKRQARADAATLNRVYAEAYAEMVNEGVEALEAIEAGAY